MRPAFAAILIATTAAPAMAQNPAAPATAQNPAAPATAQNPTALTKAMTECAVIPRDAERLACYDAAIAETSAEARAIATRRAEASAKIAAEEAAIAAAAAKAKAEADAIAAAEARRNAFGNETVRSREDRFAPPADEIQQIETAVTEVFTNRAGFSVFLLENGHLWREADIAANLNTRVGDKVRIEKTALGGYKLHLLRQKRVILVKRLK